MIAIKPFDVSRVHTYPLEAKTVTIEDANGTHQVPIEPSRLSVAQSRLGFEVYSLVPAKPPPGCIMVPGGSIVPAIYTRVFGPDDLSVREEFVQKTCEPEGSKVSAQRSGGISWPLAK